jgi:predicted nucleic acid-binding protein
VVTIGELRRGIELIRHRRDLPQALRLESWLQVVLTDYSDRILPLDEEIAQIWGRLRVPRPEHTLDRQIAATALSYGLTVVTRNQDDFKGTSVDVVNPFEM